MNAISTPFPTQKVVLEKLISNVEQHKKISEIAPPSIGRIDKMVLKINQIHNIGGQLSNNSITMEEAVLQLRGGDGLTDIIVIIVFLIWSNWHNSLFGGDAFQIMPPPHHNPGGQITGKCDNRQDPHMNYKSSKFELQMNGVNADMSPGPDFADKSTGFIMSYADGYNLVSKAYPGYMEIDSHNKISDWQAAKHMYHAPGLGVDISKYNFTQKELERIRGEEGYVGGGGLIAYARRGHRLPPIEMVRDLQENIKTKCQQSPIRRSDTTYYDVNGAWKSNVFASPPEPESKSKGIIIAFNASTGDFITGDQQRPKKFDTFKYENYLGAKKWMLKWNNN